MTQVLTKKIYQSVSENLPLLPSRNRTHHLKLLFPKYEQHLLTYFWIIDTDTTLIGITNFHVNYFLVFSISVDTLKCIIAQDCQRRMKHWHARLTSAEAVEDIYAR